MTGNVTAARSSEWAQHFSNASCYYGRKTNHTPKKINPFIVKCVILDSSNFIPNVLPLLYTHIAVTSAFILISRLIKFVNCCICCGIWYLTRNQTSCISMYCQKTQQLFVDFENFSHHSASLRNLPSARLYNTLISVHSYARRSIYFRSLLALTQHIMHYRPMRHTASHKLNHHAVHSWMLSAINRWQPVNST